MSFRLKIVLGLFALQLLLVVVLIWSSLNFLRISSEVELSNRAMVLAPSLAVLMRPSVEAGDFEELRREIDAVLFRRGVVYIRVLSPEGEVVVEGGEPGALGRSFREDFLFEEVDDEVFDVSAEIQSEAGVVGRVELGLAVGEIHEIMAAARREMASIALIGLALSIVFSWMLGNYFARQLTRLRDATRRIASGDIGYQLTVAGNDELAQTANAFNTMSRKLSTLYAEKQAALTSARQKASEVQESERRIHAVLDHAMDAIFTFDSRGYIESFNPAAERIFGRPAQEAIGERITVLIPDPFLSEQEAIIQEFLRTGDAAAFGEPREVEGRRSDGTTFPMEIDISHVELEGRFLFIAIARDISNRKRAQAELRRAQARALELSRHKFEFIAEVSDGIRTPMSEMLSALNSLSRTGIARDQQGRIEELQGAGESLITIVNDMLDFSRLEAGRLELEMIDFDLWQTVDTVYRTFYDRAVKKGLSFVYVIPADTPARVHGDPTRLRQVLANLVDNAIKFTDRGEIVLRVGAVEEWGTRAVLRFEVRDTGVGIAPAMQQRIFDILSRPDAAGERPYASSGLGLMISRRLVEMMGGRIGVQSGLGRGSTFWFTATFEKRLGGEGERPEAEKWGEGLRVLVANGDTAARHAAKAALDESGLAARCVEDGMKALDELTMAATRGEPYDVVVFTVAKPDLGGLQLARAVRADARIADTGLIMISATGYRGDGEAVRSAGVQCFLTGQVDRELLSDAVTAVARMRVGLERRAFITRHDLAASARRQGGHALVVSGDEERQIRLLARIEELGFRASLAKDAATALRAAADNRYALVLVDNEERETLGAPEISRLREAITQGAGATTAVPVLVVVSPGSSGDKRRAYCAAGADQCFAGLSQVDEIRKNLPATVASHR